MRLGFAWRFGLLLAALLCLVAGCARKQAALPEPMPPLVDVGRPIVREVTEFEFFTGRTEAADSVEVRSRVTGYLIKAPLAKSEARNGEVKEGDDIKAGRPLFEIDPSTYQAEVARAQANIKQYQALAERLEGDYRRGRSLVASRAISREELDKIAGDRSQAVANLEGAKAALRLANVNLGYTKIASPITGRLSRRMVDPGNLVKADDTILTTIVKLDPIHAYFDVDERTVIRLRTLLKAREIESARKTTLKVKLALADEEDYTREGVIDFIDNRLDPGTGTLRIRVETRNEDLFLSPGMFIRVRLPVGRPRQGLLVPEAALASKQGQKLVYTVRREEKKDKSGDTELDEDGKPVLVEIVREVPITVGQLEPDGWRVIKKAGTDGKGLSPKDEIVITGLQRVRSGREVRVSRDNKQSPAQASARPPS
jgi:RND family efflux transporter MFP subunit